jgi:hypothetical protein
VLDEGDDVAGWGWVERGHQVGMGGFGEAEGREDVMDGTMERGPEGSEVVPRGGYVGYGWAVKAD